ncbi:MAG: hypothetical protein LQ345_005152 [Seirophora villosa]|nr:MAG: hypothetical protein LQ345_005152 [Seirophora villosa]
MTSRLVAKLLGNARMQVRGPVDEAVEKGARLYSIDSASFLAIFNAIKSELMIRADKTFEIIVRAPGSSQVSNDLDLVWSIRWPDQLSKYNGDLENYIWRPHALVMFSSTRLLQTFKKQFISERPVFSSTTAHLIILLHMIHAVFRVALSETRDFMQDAQQQVFDMTLKSRLHPSKEKFQHLLYLKDCGKYAGRGMTHNKELLYAVEERVKHMIPANDGSEEARLLEKLMSEVKEDLEYAEKELERIGKSIGDLRKDVFAHA